MSLAVAVDEDNHRDVSAIRMRSYSNAAQLAELVRLVDAGILKLWIADRRPLQEIADVQAGPLAGKTIILP